MKKIVAFSSLAVFALLTACATTPNNSLAIQKENNLYEVTGQEKDFTTQTWLQFFITEQIEEESTVRGILDKFEMVGDNKSGYYLLDQELAVLGARPVGVPAA